MEEFDVKQEIQKIKDEMDNAKNALVPKEEPKDEDTLALIHTEKKEVLNSAGAQGHAKILATEDVKATFAEEAEKIRRRNVETAEKHFDTETRKRRLERLNKEMDLQHKYDMAIIMQNGEHKKMLDRRRKLVEKYGYLYDMRPENCIQAVDGHGENYLVPRDFSYSEGVNKFRQFGRNIGKLDKPILQTIKWVAIVGACIGAYFLLRWIGIFR